MSDAESFRGDGTCPVELPSNNSQSECDIIYIKIPRDNINFREICGSAQPHYRYRTLPPTGRPARNCGEPRSYDNSKCPLVPSGRSCRTSMVAAKHHFGCRVHLTRNARFLVSSTGFKPCILCICSYFEWRESLGPQPSHYLEMTVFAGDDQLI